MNNLKIHGSAEHGYKIYNKEKPFPEYLKGRNGKHLTFSNIESAKYIIDLLEGDTATRVHRCITFKII